MSTLQRSSLILSVAGWGWFLAGWLVLLLPGANRNLFTVLGAVALLSLTTFVAAIVCALKSRERSPAPYRRNYRFRVHRVALWLSAAGLVTLITPVVIAGMLLGGMRC